jgi:hypothetical protein
LARGPNTLARVLRSSGIVHNLLSQAQDLRLLLTRVRKHLPPPLDGHCLAALVKKRQLILFVDSPAWASRLRYYSRDLKSQLLREGMRVERISIRVMINDTPVQHKKPAAAKRLSPDNASLIRQTAEGISDEDLSAALKRLGRHT